MDDVESQAPHGDTGREDQQGQELRNTCRLVGFFATLIVVGIVCTVVPAEYFMVDTQYSVGIDSVSGLDPSPVGLSFNLTLGVTSRSHGSKACINPGMSVEVLYHGVQVAASEAETRRFCAGPRKTAEMHVVARATGVPVGRVLDTLTAEMRQGEAVFDFRLHVPANSYGGVAARTSWLTDCKGTQVGDATVPCASP